MKKRKVIFFIAFSLPVLAFMIFLCVLGEYIPFSEFYVKNKIEKYILQEYGVSESVICVYDWYDSVGEYLVLDSDRYKQDWEIKYNRKTNIISDNTLEHKSSREAAADMGKMWRNQPYEIQKLGGGINTNVNGSTFKKQQTFVLGLKNISNVTEQEGYEFAVDNIYNAIQLLNTEKYSIKTIGYSIEDIHKVYSISGDFEKVANLTKEELRDFIKIKELGEKVN